MRNDDEPKFEIDTSRQLPVVVTPAAPRKRGFARVSSPSPFISHLLAEKQHPTAERDTRRGSADQAKVAYDTSANITVRRMPAGYRKTVVA